METTKAGINRRTAAPLLPHGFHRAALEALDLDRLRSNGYALHLPPTPRVSPPVPAKGTLISPTSGSARVTMLRAVEGQRGGGVIFILWGGTLLFAAWKPESLPGRLLVAVT